MPLDDILEAFGTKLVTDVRSSLVANGVVFGGGGESKLSARTQFKISQSKDGLTFNLIMPDYTQFVNKGRGKGPVSREGREGIGEWGRRKGYIGPFINREFEARKKRQDAAKSRLSPNSTRKFKTLKKMPFEKGKEAFSFVVARSITEKGYKGNHFLDEVLNDGRVDQLQKDISAELKKNIIIEIKR